jgi:hypothetical protein
MDDKMKELLAQQFQEDGVAAQTAEVMFTTFGPHFMAMMDETGKSKSIVVTEESQTQQMAAAKAARKVIGKVRTATEATRVETKAEALRFSQVTDKVARMIMQRCKDEEARLEEAATFGERAEAARAQERRVERTAALGPFGTNTMLFDLGSMPEADWKDFYGREKEAWEARERAKEQAAWEAKKADEERRAREAELAAENRRLKEEADKVAAQAAAEQAKRDAAHLAALAKVDSDNRARQAVIEEQNRKDREQIEKDRAAAAKILRDAQAKLEAEQEEQRAKEREAEEAKEAAERAERAAANAPDADKLRALALSLRQLEYPEVGAAAQTAIARVRGGVAKMSDYLDEQAGLLASGELK